MPARDVGRSRLVGLLVVALGLWLLTGCAGGSSQEEEQSEQADTFTVVAPRDVQEQIDLGDEGISVGDLYVFSGPIYDESENSELGRIDGQCTTTSAPGPSAELRRLCIANATFVEEHGGSEIDAQGVGRLEAEDVVLAITGGTGDYRNARGQATFEFQSDGRVVITYEVDEANP
jgi:hypothetical protein